MAFFNMSGLVFLCLVLSFKGKCEASSQFSVKFLKAPPTFSHHNSAKFVFQLLGTANFTCSHCSIICKLDDGSASDCRARKILYSGLQDGNHSFVVCINGSRGPACSSYNWTVDTVPPTAFITSSTPFTSTLNVSVNISFTESCSGGGGFRCSSVNDCNLLVYGAGEVVPSSLTILEPNLKYLLFVSISSASQYGRLVLVMDRDFCSDAAGNPFTRSPNSTFYVHYDRRSVFVDLRVHVPEKLLQLQSEVRTVQATNNYNNLKVYLYFSTPILNSSTEILSSLSISQGTLLPIIGEHHGNRRFGFMVANISNIAIITISLSANSTISRQGTPVSPIAPVTFLYDSQRTAVRLSTSHMRTQEDNIPISIKFKKPVFYFNSSLISISGGKLRSFHEISRSIYAAEILADDDVVSVSVPENVTGDVAGNKNLASNVLRVRHYTIPVISSVISIFVTAVFLVTCFTAGLLTMSTASLQSVGAFSRPSSSLSSDPARILFRSACHIQVFALIRWLPVTLPVEYYEFAKSLEWSIPYFSLPWETGHVQPVMMGASPSGTSSSFLSQAYDREISHTFQPKKDFKIAAAVYGSPLTPIEYRSFFESQSIIPEAEYISDRLHSNGWRNFDRSLFWLAVIGGSLILLHAFLFLILKYKKRDSEKQRSFGALIFPRLEIFLVILALPCICQASAALVAGGTPSGVVVGILLLGAVAFVLLSLFLFLSVGITFGKLLLYKEVHQEGQQFHWYQELIRVTLGPGKRGQWTWKNEATSIYLTMLGPLFEDLRGPPKYMVSQISGSSLSSSRQGDRIIASDDETEDAEAPFIQKLFGILRIYYTMLESAKRVTLGVLVGAYLDNRASKTPITVMLCITSFQLFFLVLKKPFIKKRVQLVEIISLCCEVGMFATCLVLLEKESSIAIGVPMLILFLVRFMAQMVGEGYALYEQTKQLDTVENSFFTGLKIASIGFLLYFIPQKLMKSFESKFPVFQCMETTSFPGDSNKSTSETLEKPWPKQLREMAKASFSKDGSNAPTDPSSSRTKWSGLWGTKRSGSSSVDSHSDFKPKSKSKGLYKDLEAIFASK
ncbi:uncharacterized protein LOC120201425 isoform X1 [Hibiscus syriacus]|uniref:uncharacterized protein LOC120201425 isoform X1 n=1 Tax=Hibiscus syriacus TaxID=106335 RepID=UPI001920E580|nr:uncharacterized protein LOC120201425 isoform X1 [Hibiscus syriacus]